MFTTFRLWVLLVCCPFASILAQQRLFYVIDFQSPTYQYLNQNRFELATYCLRFAQDKQLTPYILTPTLAIKTLPFDSIESRLQRNEQEQLVGIVQQAISPKNLTICVFDVIKTNQNEHYIQYLHFFNAIDTVNLTQNLSRAVISFSFPELLKVWQSNQFPRVLADQSKAKNYWGFGNVLHLTNDMAHERMIRVLAEATKQYVLTPYLQLIKTNTTLPLGTYQALKEAALGNVPSGWLLRTEEKPTSKGLKIKHIQLFTDGEQLTNYQPLYLASFNYDSCKLLKNKPIIFSADTILQYYLPTLHNMPKQLLFTMPIDTLFSTQSYILPNMFPSQAKQYIWTDLDTREITNQVLAKKRNELSRWLIRGVMDSLWKTYDLFQDDWQFDLQPLTNDEWLKRLSLRDEQPISVIDGKRVVVSIEDLDKQEIRRKKNENRFKKDKLYKHLEGDYYAPQYLYRLQGISKVTFDAKGNNKKYELLYISVVLPAEFSSKGLDETLFWVRVSDLKAWAKYPKKLRYKSKNLKRKLTFIEGIEQKDFSYTIWEGSSIFE